MPEGDAERGKATFVALQCNACHTVDGVELDASVSEDVTTVALGGKKGYVVTYGDLVTSIINPSHRFALGYKSDEIQEGEVSKMRSYNDEMTVTQLADLVTFLQQHYEVEIYVPTPFVPYY
ncbi:cytochrome C [Rhodopirellula sp. SM50]|nr:cytochrome C [Rhodopirellula sp. SM50]